MSLTLGMCARLLHDKQARRRRKDLETSNWQRHGATRRKGTLPQLPSDVKASACPLRHAKQGCPRKAIEKSGAQILSTTLPCLTQTGEGWFLRFKFVTARQGIGTASLAPRVPVERPGAFTRCFPALRKPSESISAKSRSPLLPPRLLHEFAFALVGSPWGRLGAPSCSIIRALRSQDPNLPQQILRGNKRFYEATVLRPTREHRNDHSIFPVSSLGRRSRLGFSTGG